MTSELPTDHQHLIERLAALDSGKPELVAEMVEAISGEAEYLGLL